MEETITNRMWSLRSVIMSDKRKNRAVLLLLSSSLLCVILLSFSQVAHALDPNEIAVIANSQEREGVELARFYMKQRHIPKENLLILKTAVKEDISRHFYEDEIADPIRKFIEDKPTITCLLLFYGLPLRIDWHLLPMEKTDQKQEKLNARQRDPVASVDSELSLVRIANPPVHDWLENPYFVQFQKHKTRYEKGQVLMVSRLDGPDPATVKRVIMDSLTAEKKGLTGTAYFDARWPKPEADKTLSGYALYDNAIHMAAKVSEPVLPVVLNEEESLFQEGDAPNAALYCGWYSLARYRDAFEWQQGAVAYHIASAECRTLKKKGSQVWCKRLLEDGVAATIGPVGEPYVQGFPFPQIFFGLLLDGDFSLVEAYYLSLPFISWKMVLIGDPLYQPFRQRGVLP